ncbi:MAG: hypothetical protein H7X95_10685, partial [Deltaproteobacteria bacterium]|nr:hypothetical protein [Deltaproteobacteria bacterium]
MKTITEFPGIVLREAARIRRAHRPAEVEAVPTPEASKAETTAADVAAANAMVSEGAAPVDASAVPAGTPVEVDSAAPAAADAQESSGASDSDTADVSTADSAEAAASPSDGEAAPEADAAEADATETPVSTTEDGDAAVAAAAPPVVDPAELAANAAAAAQIEADMGITGDRLARLFEALDSVKQRVDNVRLIRVLQGENPPANARKVGEHYYVADLMPQGQGRRDDRGDRGGRGGDRQGQQGQRRGG